VVSCVPSLDCADGCGYARAPACPHKFVNFNSNMIIGQIMRGSFPTLAALQKSPWSLSSSLLLAPQKGNIGTHKQRAALTNHTAPIPTTPAVCTKAIEEVQVEAEEDGGGRRGRGR
jgi:hypothetical protein